jgi:hypothetical protein
VWDLRGFYCGFKDGHEGWSLVLGVNGFGVIRILSILVIGIFWQDRPWTGFRSLDMALLTWCLLETASGSFVPEYQHSNCEWKQNEGEMKHAMLYASFQEKP